MTRRLIWLLPVLLCLGSTECRNQEDDLGEEEDVRFATLEYDTGSPVHGTVSGIESRMTIVVRDVNAFANVWSDHGAALAPVPAQPDVEFGTDMVIAAFMGRQPTGGYGITIEEVRENDEFVIVEIELETPGEECEVTAAETQPYHMILLPDSDKPVQFSENTVESTC